MLASLPHHSPSALRRLLILTLLVGLSTGACDRNAPQGPNETEDQTEQAAEQQESTAADADPGRRLVAEGGPIAITIDDVAIAVNRMRLMAATVPGGELPDDDPEWMSYPQAQMQMLNNLVQFAIARHEAEQRDLSIDDDRLREFIGDHPTLRRYAPLFRDGDPETNDPETNDPATSDGEADNPPPPASREKLRSELAAVDLSKDDVAHLAEDMLYLEALDDDLGDEFSDDQLWNVYQTAYDQAALVVASIRNTPTSQELDRAMSQYDRQIRAYYRDNRDRFRNSLQLWGPTLAPADRNDQAPEAIEALLTEAAQRLADNDDPQTIADDLDLVLEERAFLHRRFHPGAQAGQPGDTGVSLNDRATMAWRIDEREEPSPRSLDRPLRREIASIVIRQEEGITPANRQRAQQAQQILEAPEASQELDQSQIDDLLAALEDEGFEAVYTDYFSLRTSGAIPELGLAENLLEATRQADLDDPIIAPTLDRQSVHVARLVQRQHPDRETFAEERDEFRAEFLSRNDGRLAQRYIRDFRSEHGIRLDRRPIIETYGVAQKPTAPRPTNAPGGAPSPGSEPAPTPSQ